MEEIKTNKKTSRLMEVLSTAKAKYILGTILLSGIGITLPRIFHMLAGSHAGATFLPMHLAVLIAGLVFGAMSASVVAGSSVVFSYLLTGMPTLERLPYMLIEHVIYAVLLGIFNKKLNAYISLMATIILGRVFYWGVLWAAIHILSLSTYGITVMQSVKAGIPGIMIQLACVPFISKAIKKGIHLDG